MKNKNNIPVSNELISSREIVQSYLITTAGRNFGRYAEKILMSIVKTIQSDIKDLDFITKQDLRPHEATLQYGDRLKIVNGKIHIIIPVKEIMNGDTHNYTYVRKSVEALQTQIIRWEWDKLDDYGNPVIRNGEVVKNWKSTQLIGTVIGEDQERGQLDITVEKEILDAILDFTNGFRAYDLSVAMRLKKKYSLRIYQLVSRQKSKISFKLEDLKKQWGLKENQYRNVADLEKRILKPSQTELNGESPWSFEYIIENKPEGYTISFIPKKLEINNPKKNNYLYNDAVMSLFDDDVKGILIEEYKFTWIDINKTYKLFCAAQRLMKGEDEKHPTLSTFLKKLSNASKYADDRKAYICGAVKIHLNTQYPGWK